MDVKLWTENIGNASFEIADVTNLPLTLVKVFFKFIQRNVEEENFKKGTFYNKLPLSNKEPLVRFRRQFRFIMVVDVVAVS